MHLCIETNIGSCLCIENDITGEIGYVTIHSMPAQYPFLFVCVFNESYVHMT